MTFLLFSFLLCLRGAFSYILYKNFISKKVVKIDGFVANQYKKKNYYVLKIKSKNLTFYTINRDDLKNLLNEDVSVKIFTKHISFKNYLFGFFAPSFDLKLKEPSKIEKYVENQHKNIKITNLYKALYFGKSIDFSTRKDLSTLGISHLFALSGLHLGFLSAILFFMLNPVYKFFQSRFFPYRNRYFDLGIFILTTEFLYLYFTNFPSSLVRAFVMETVIFISLIYLEKEPLSVLIWTFLISVLIFFEKVFSIGYFLSFMGVYYIFLFFKYFKPTFVNSLILSFYMYLVMFILGHYFFYNFNFYSFFSPVVNILFSVFYPVSIFLHLTGFGGLFDKVLQWYLNMGEKNYYVNVDFWILLFFLSLSFFAYYRKWAFYGINLFALIVILIKI
ncbi:ComEC/Rec2 family competence protein [Lebetimonas sp. JS032]|uniref:ComEC/Rec2 family competence protein n=1 Tax=Lebetimonas sp. JS032 TaxID=990070 RepID=UPI0004678EE0|nr:ComEC/Rec2 family competence protein [Lebetimonas sp. JS032]